jgi:hypothetical protein
MPQAREAGGSGWLSPASQTYVSGFHQPEAYAPGFTLSPASQAKEGTFKLESNLRLSRTLLIQSDNYSPGKSAQLFGDA